MYNLSLHWFNSQNNLKTNDNALICRIMLMPIHFVYKLANVNANANANAPNQF